MNSESLLSFWLFVREYVAQNKTRHTNKSQYKKFVWTKSERGNWKCIGYWNWRQGIHYALGKKTLSPFCFALQQEKHLLNLLFFLSFSCVEPLPPEQFADFNSSSAKQADFYFISWGALFRCAVELISLHNIIIIVLLYVITCMLHDTQFPK